MEMQLRGQRRAHSRPRTKGMRDARGVNRAAGAYAAGALGANQQQGCNGWLYY